MQEDKRNMCRTELVGGGQGGCYLTSRGCEGGTQRIVGQCLKPSGSINQTVHLSWVVCLSLHLCDCTFTEQCRIIIYINSLRLSVTELGSVRLTRPGPALLVGQSSAVRGVRPGPSQKADWARLGTPTAVTEPGVTLVRTD